MKIYPLKFKLYFYKNILFTFTLEVLILLYALEYFNL